MQSVVGIFTSSGTACGAVDALARAGLSREHIGLLMPGTLPREVERRVPPEDAESPGMGAAVGGVIGGAVGLSAAAIVLPGVGPLVLAGLLAAGVAGTAGGAALGDSLEDVLSGGVPHDELRVYEQALRRGRSIVVVLIDGDGEAESAREALRGAGAETVDAARRDWRTGLRYAAAQ